MKKIGVLTFHSAVNFGAVLQGYALVRALNELGADAELIDYHASNESEMTTFRGRFKRGIKKGIEFVLIYSGWSQRKKKFWNFLNCNRVISRKRYTNDNISQANAEYDTFIVGSDQIWNLHKTGFDFNYFLSFVDDNKKKNAYAASAGTITPELLQALKENIGQFSNVSVRELELQEACKKVIGRNAELVVDPVFLLTKEKWREIAFLPKEKNYILVYGLAKSDELISFARKMGEKTGKRILYLNVRAEKPMGIKSIINAGAEEFLGYFINADYVITNSFHGTAFSILLNKEFFVSALKQKHMGNARLQTVLLKFGLEDRFIQQINCENHIVKIDYKRVNRVIEEERKKAQQFLQQIVD